MLPPPDDSLLYFYQSSIIHAVCGLVCCSASYYLSSLQKSYKTFYTINLFLLISRAAAEAAMARIQKKDTREFNTSLAAIKAQVKRELEAERKLKEEAAAKLAGESKDNANQSENKNLACQGVFFRCPLISEEILPKKEWKAKIKEFLFEQLELERGLTACLIIQNCNVKEKVRKIRNISTYLLVLKDIYILLSF